MKRATAILILVWLGLATAGCGPKARLRDDPFAPSTGRSRPPPPTSDPFESANQRARERDHSADVSTSPLTDPFTDARAAEGEREPRGQNVSRPARAVDPFESGPRPATRSAEGDEVAADAYQEIRRRLDRIGARNVRSETDEETGEHLFHCELPNPRDPVVFRVFEARHADEQKAMLAVTESAERWAEGQP